MLVRRVTTTALTRWATKRRVVRLGAACGGGTTQPAASNPASKTKPYVPARAIPGE